MTTARVVRVAATSRRGAALPLGDVIAAQAGHQPDATCFVTSGGRHHTFGEVNRSVDRLATAFQDRGYRRGDRIAIIGNDSVQFVEIVLACLKIGLVHCTINVRLNPLEWQDMLARTEPVLLAVDTRYRAAAASVCSALSSAPDLVTLDGGVDEPASIDALIAAAGDDRAHAAVAYGEDIVCIAFTSGTTGRPKAVLQSERMVRQTIMGGLRELRIRQDDFRYNGPPMYHVSGIGSVLFGVVAGCRTLILPQFDADLVLSWMHSGELTSIFLVPTMLSAMLALPDLGSRPLPRLRSLIYGAAPMTPALLRRILDIFDCDLYNIFGPGTEGAWQATLTPEDHRAALDGRPELLQSVGRPVPGVQLRIVDELLNDVPRGVVGHIISRSETVMSGYLEEPVAEEDALVDGWLRSGDLASMDAAGYVFLASRTADMIIRGGENIYPIEIETCLAEHVGVDQVAVVGRPDEHWGQVVAAAVVRMPGHDVTAPQLQAFCRARLAAFKVPSMVVFVDALPLNATGKVQKDRVSELFTAAVLEADPSK